MTSNDRLYKLGILTTIILVGFVGCTSLPDCSPMVKYSESKLSIKGIELPLQTDAFKVGEAVWEPQTVQKATVLTQIMDNYRISMCNHMKAARGASNETFERSLLRVQEEEMKLNQLAVLVVANNPKAVERWIETYGSHAEAVSQGKDPGAASQLRSLDSLIADVTDIKEQLKSRRLAPSELSKLIETLSNGPRGKLDMIGFIGGDSESKDFALDLMQAIERGGWTINNLSSLIGPTFRGLEVSTQNPEAVEVKALLSALSSIGLIVRVKVFPKWPTNAVNLTVGSRP